MEKRLVIPEILDHLPADDPDALRSRRDLRRINFLMGNERWVCRAIRKFPAQASRGVVEIGAGDGELIRRIARIFPASPVSAYDLAPRPEKLPPWVVWNRGDLFAAPAPTTGGVLIANLFLHHFEGDSLIALGRWMAGFEVLIFNEPDRAKLPHWLGAAMHPFINRVTRHDMHVSIRAGFSRGEMMEMLGLDWKYEESSTWRGARHVLASRV